jgi:hypothetical protein
MTAIENEVLALRHRLGIVMAQSLIDEQAAQSSVASAAEAPCCPHCGGALVNKGRRKKSSVTRVGEVESDRPYAYCPHCKRGVFPLDQQLELCAGQWSRGYTQLAVRLSAVLPFEQAAVILEEAFQLPTAVTTLWRRTQEVGQRLQAVQERRRRQATALPPLWEPPIVRQADKRMGVALDGAIINLRQEGWKELKIACVFGLGVRRRADPLSGEEVAVARAVDTSYVAHLGGPDAIGDLLLSEARRRQWEEAGDTLVLGDGAPWIWNQAALHFPDSQQLVDWYHARSHLVEAAKLLKGEGTPACERWLERRTLTLYQGHAAKLAHELTEAAAAKPPNADALTRAAGYFAGNAKRMNYLEMREALWPIGSGVVESAAKQFKARFCGSGMHWSRTGAEQMATLRATILHQTEMHPIP